MEVDISSMHLNMHPHFRLFSFQPCREHIFPQWKINTPTKCGSVNLCSLDYGTPFLGLVSLRILFVLINSLYSFWWDVVIDWNLSIFTEPSSPGAGLWGLRKSIHFRSPNLYYTAIALDLVLRLVSPNALNLCM